MRRPSINEKLAVVIKRRVIQLRTMDDDGDVRSRKLSVGMVEEVVVVVMVVALVALGVEGVTIRPCIEGRYMEKESMAALINCFND